MREKTVRIVSSSAIAISLLIHLLLLVSFSWVYIPVAKVEPHPGLYVPSYLYHEVVPAHASALSKITDTSVKKPARVTPRSKNGILKPALASQSHVAQPKAVSSHQMTDPVHLLGDKHVQKPLITLIAKAITAHLEYPKIAMDFNLKGITYIQFTLHPDGRVTDIQLLKSSSTQVLDEAVLAAVHALSPIAQVNLYLHEAKPIVFGIIFS